MRYSSQVARFTTIICAGAFSAALLSGCGREEVTTYRVPKADAPAGHFEGDGHDHSGHNHASVPALEWKTPEGWEVVPPGQMRAASFRIKGKGEATADVGVFPLPGLAGSDLDNVNRWRGQVGLGPVKQDELASLAEGVEVDKIKAEMYDLAGENVAAGEKLRILAAIVRKEGVAWFFKMTGEDALVAAQKGRFKEFVEGVTFTVGGGMPSAHPPIDGMAGLPASHPPIDGMGLPPSHPPIGGMTTAGMQQPGGGESSKPSWSIPKGWVEVPAGQFLAAKFQLKGVDGSEGTVNVSVSAGEGGGAVGNINRWRGQLGLEVLPADKLNLEKVQANGAEATLVDLRGVDLQSAKKLRLIGVVAPTGDRTWFYKLMGDEAAVEREKENFIQFVKGALGKPEAAASANVN